MSESSLLNLSPTPSVSAADKFSIAKGCDLCGLPLGRAKTLQKIGKETFHFCCSGCRQVFIILSSHPDGRPGNFRETDLYRACLLAGIIPGNQDDLTFRDFEIPAAEEGKALQSLNPDLDPNTKQNLSLDLSLQVQGMWCPACCWLIEQVLRRTKGILEARVSFLSDRVNLRYLPHQLSPTEIMERISKLGYHPSLQLEQEAIALEKKDLLVRLGISAILTVNIMMVSFALYIGLFRDLSPEVISYFSYPIWLMATPVLLYGGLPILKKGIAGFLYRSPTMESLIFVASLSAYLYSLYRMSQGSLHLYFDTASMLITLVLLGRWIEIHVRGKVAGGMAGLSQLTRQKVRLLDQERERWVSSDGVSPGDSFVVFAGERVPLDGKVLEGRGDMDESVLTGEARPVHKDPGDEVKAGAFLLSGEINVRTTRTGRESSLGQIIALMQGAIEKKNPAEIMADRITRWFVPTILAIAGATGLYLWLLSSTGDEVFLRSLAVLAIACPCSLGIATPIVKLASVGLAKSQGMLVRDPAALEKMKDLDVLVFDKTGTLTEGHFHLQEMVNDEGTGPGQALPLIASVEVHSDHFLAREVLRKVRGKSLKLEEVEGFESLDGMGVKGRVLGREIFIGNRKLMGWQGLEISAALEKRAEEAETRGMTAVFAGWEGKVQSLLLFGDSLRKGIREMVEGVHARGIKTWVVSGDSRATTESVSRQSGIPEFRSEALPQDKVELIRTLQAAGWRVGMVGDGINDAAALAQADVGFALGAGSNIIQEASDFTLLSSDPGKVLDALELSSKAVGAIRQNLFFAFFYNSFGIPLAMAGWLNPLIAAFAMFASSLTVIGNALRISRGKGSRGEKNDPPPD